MSTISTTTDPRTGITYLDHRGSTMGRPTGGRAPPADRKDTPPPLRRLSEGHASSTPPRALQGRAVCGRYALSPRTARECALSDGNLPVSGKVPVRFTPTAAVRRPARLPKPYAPESLPPPSRGL